MFSIVKIVRNTRLAGSSFLLACMVSVLPPTITTAAIAGAHPDEQPATTLPDVEIRGIEVLYARVSALRRQYGSVSLPVARGLVEIADALGSRKDYAAAHRYLREAREIVRAVPGSHDLVLAGIDRKSAELFVAEGLHLSAEPLYARSLDTLRGVLPAGHSLIATAINDLGVVRHELGHFRSAELLFQELLSLRQATYGSLHRKVATTVNNLAEVYRAQGRYAEAEALYRRALEIDVATLGESHPAYATGLNNLAMLRLAQARYGEAEALLNGSIAILESSGQKESRNLAMALNNLAEIYSAQGRYEDAEAFHERALATREAVSGAKSPDVAMSLNNLGLLYLKQDRLGEAEPLLRRAIRLLEDALGQEHPGVAAALSNLAELYETQARYADAEPLQKRALRLLESRFGEDHPAVANLLNNLASLYVYTRRYDEALTLQRRALEIRERHLPSGHPDINMSLNNLAAIYRYSDRPREAEVLLERAISNAREAGRGEEAATAKFLNNLAVIFKEQTKYGKAEKHYRRAIDIVERWFGPDHPAVAPYVANLATFLHERGRYAEALEAQRRAVTILRQRIAQIAPVATEGVFGEQLRLRDFFVGHVVMLEAAAEAGAESREAAARESFETAQLAIQRTASQAVARMSARFAAGDDALAAVVRQQQDAKRRWQALDRQLLTAVSSPQEQRDSVTEERLREDLVKVEGGLDEVERRLEKEFPDYATLAAPAPVTLLAAQALLGGEELLLQALVARKATYVWAVRKDRVAFYKADLGRDALDESVQALRIYLDRSRNPTRDRGARRLERQVRDFDIGAAEALYRKLLGPAQEVFPGVRQILFVPDGALQSLPLHLLVMPRLAGDSAPTTDLSEVRWLVREFATTAVPSVASFASLRRVAGPAEAPRPFLGIGDPLLAGDPGGQVTADAGSLFARGAVADVDNVRRLPLLPETAHELRTIGRALGADDESLYLRERATERMIKSKQDLNQYRVIAFATHGLMAGEFNGLAEPALVLTPPGKGSRVDDGLLTAGEIAGLKLDADWVVLSACNTAAADGTPGADGLSGLARVFFYAGSRALLVSHWAVDSQAAVALTTRMFEELARAPRIERAEALRQAMLAMLDDPDHPARAHPRFWAPFIIVGDGR